MTLKRAARSSGDLKNLEKNLERTPEEHGGSTERELNLL